MASPVFRSGKEFKSNATFDQQGNVVTVDQLEAQYGAPSATAVDTGRMSYEGTIAKTAGIAILAGIVAVPGYLFPNTGLMIVGAIVGFVLSMIIIFRKKASPALIAIYAIAEGYFLGAITIYVEQSFNVPGAGLQALLATGITFAVCLTLYRTGVVRYTSKMRKFMLIGFVAYFAFSLVNIGYMIFGSSNSAWGLRSEITVFGMPLGVVIGIVAVLLACMSLIADFDFIENAVKNGAPINVEWKAAFGLILTLVWLYIEFLRIIALVMGRR